MVPQHVFNIEPVGWQNPNPRQVAGRQRDSPRGFADDHERGPCGRPRSGGRCGALASWARRRLRTRAGSLRWNPHGKTALTGGPVCASSWEYRGDGSGAWGQRRCRRPSTGASECSPGGTVRCTSGAGACDRRRPLPRGSSWSGFPLGDCQAGLPGPGGAGAG